MRLCDKAVIAVAAWAILIKASITMEVMIMVHIKLMGVGMFAAAGAKDLG